MNIAPGQTVLHYRVIDKIGEGGMGIVWRALDTHLDREVALKVLPERLASDPERLARFEREAKMIAALNHPNIVTIYAVERAAGTPMLTMELVEGRSLDRLIPEGGLPLERFFSIAGSIADALAAAHAKGITHRDLKPANVMVASDGRVKVLDFGLAKLFESDKDVGSTQAPTIELTREGVVVGTVAYMAPEQLEAGAVDPRSDIFSLGVLLHEMVTGMRPFQGRSSAAVMSSILRDEPDTVSELRSGLPHHLGRIVRRCLEKQPDRRYQSALDVRNELDGLRRELETGELSSTDSTATTTGRSAMQLGVPEPRRRWGAPVWAWGVAGLVVLVALAVSLLRPEPGPAPSAAVPPEAGTSVAVLPFQNLGADESVDYLRLAVPDEITTALSRAPGLAVRPFSMTAALQPATVDSSSTGRDLGVGHVVTGQYYQEGERLNLTLEAVDVGRNAVVWRDSVVVSAQDLISLREKVAARVQQALLPALGFEATADLGGTLPTDKDAYDKYLRSLPASSDPVQNQPAITLLEEAVRLDPAFAPAWSELAGRYYYDGNYGGGGDAAYDRAAEAARRALELDPGLIDAAVRLIVLAVERGRLTEAYDDAERLLARRPDAARAHFVRAYVMRYAGAVDRAVRDCDTALALDPRNPMLRSCGIANAYAGRYDRALQFFALDSGSTFKIDNTAATQLRMGKPDDALQTWLSAGNAERTRAYQLACLRGQEVPAIVKRRLVSFTLGRRDSELPYWYAAVLAYCGDHEPALELIREGIERGYCSYPILENDNLLDGLRTDPAVADDYARVVEAGRACHERFLAHLARG